MPLPKARRTNLSGRAGRPDGVSYRQQYIRCGKASCPAAHRLDPVIVRTGTASTWTIASAPAASTSAKPCQPASSCASTRTPFTPTHLTTRRMPARPKLPELSTARESGDRLGKCRRALARLGQACGLPTFPQTDDALASLAVYHSHQSSFRSVRRWPRCTTFIPT